MITCRSFKIHVEVPTLLLFFAYTLAASVTTNLIIYRTCYVTMGYNKSDCALLGSNYSNNGTADLEEKVQHKATIILISLALVEAIIPPIFCLFYGPWSDTYGRKPLLLGSIGGCMFSFVVMVVVTALENASPWFFLLFLVPMCLTGGVSSLLTTILCYIIDVTSEEYRGIRMGLFDGVVTAGTILGTSLSSFVLNWCGYVTIYSICTGCVLLAWLYTYFLIPESVEHVETEHKLRNLFKFSLVKESLKSTLRSKEHYDRGILLTLILMIAIYVFSNYGDTSVVFLYLREKFHWTLRTYTIYSTIVNVGYIIGAIFGIFVLHKFLRINEPFVILLGFLSIITGSLLQGLTSTSLLIYIAAGIKLFSGAVKPMALSLLSKLVPIEDSGKVFPVVTSLQIIGALLGTSVYTYMYNTTLGVFPATFNFVTCGIHIFQVVLIILIVYMQRRRDESITYSTIDC